MDTQQLRSFVKSVVYTMEDCGLTGFSNNRIIVSKDKNGNPIYGWDYGYSIMQNTPTERADNKTAQADFQKILDNYYASKEKGCTEKEIKILQLEKNNIWMTVYDGGMLAPDQIKNVKDALAYDAKNNNAQLINHSNNIALQRVYGLVDDALKAASLNRKGGPGELNSVAPNPYLLAEVAAWANQGKTADWNALTGKNGYLQTAKNISLTDFNSNYLYTRGFFTRNPNDKNKWPGRIQTATTNALKQINATVSAFWQGNPLVPNKAFSSLGGVVNASNVSSTANYLSMFKNSLGNWDGYLWSFTNSTNLPLTPGAGGIEVFAPGAVLLNGGGGNYAALALPSIFNADEMYYKGNWSQISTIGDPQIEVASNTNDANGNLLKSSDTLIGEGGEIISTDNKTNTYGASGNLLSTFEAKTDMSGIDTSGKAATTDITYSTFASSGNQLSNSEDQVDASGNITNTDSTYDASGNLLSSSVAKVDANGGMTKTYNTYNAGASLLSVTETQTDAGGAITDNYHSSVSNGFTTSSQTQNGNLTYQASATLADGSVGTATYDTSTGTYNVFFSDPKGEEFTVTPDAGGGYQLSWTFVNESSNPRISVTGSYDTSTGAYTTSDPYDRVYVVKDGNTVAIEGPFYSSDAILITSTTYDGNGGYQQQWETPYDWGENDYSADGSYTKFVKNPDGSTIAKAYDASTGVTVSTFSDGHGGYQSSWTRSDGYYGEDDKYDDGSYTNTLNSPDGTVETSTYDASTGITEFDQKKADGSYVYETFNTDGSVLESKYDASTNSTAAATFDADGSITYEKSITKNSDGSSETYLYDAGMTTDTIDDGNGGFTQSWWDANDGSWGENDQSDNGSTLSTTHNADGSSETYSYNVTTGITTDTAYDGSGGYVQAWWNSDDGTSGEKDVYDDGSYQYTTDNADGSSTISSYDAATGTYDNEVDSVDGSYTDIMKNSDGSTSTYTYDASTGVYGDYEVYADGSWMNSSTTYDGNGGSQETWTASDGSSGSITTSDDGSTLSTTNNADGSSTIIATSADGSTIDTTNKDSNGNILSTRTDVFTTDSTGAMTEDYKEFSADGSLADETITATSADGSTIDTTNKDGNGNIVSTSTDVTTTDANGNSTENYQKFDGNGNLTYESSTTTNPDGSSTTSTYTVSTGVYGHDVKNADGSWTDYQTTYDGNGSYNQTWTASNGQTGVNDKSDDGSTLNSTTNPDGSSTTSTYTASTGVYGYDVVNANGSWTDYQTTYDGNGGYDQTWTASNGQTGVNDKSDDGSTLTSTTNPDGSSTTSTYDPSTGVYGYDVVNANGSWTDYSTTYDNNGGYDQTWTASNGQTGVKDKSDDGSTLSTTTNPDGSSTTSRYNPSTGIYGYDVVNANGSWTDYSTTYDGKGGYNQTWTSSNGQTGVNDKADDGSTLSTTTNPDGSSTTSTYNPSTGVYGYDVVNADGSWTDYSTTYDGNGGYDQTWTSSNGQTGVNDKSDDGSTLTSTTNPDGSSTTSTYTASTGVYGYDVVNADGSWTDYSTTYDGNGGYDQTWTSSNGQTGVNDKSDDGSTLTSTTNPDGSSTTSTYTASTGVYGYDIVNANGSWTDYNTTYDGNGGYDQTWTSSSGQTGVNEKSDDGSTLSSTTNPDGSSTTSTYTPTTGVYGYDVKNADGSWTDYNTTYDGNGGYNQTWTASNGQSGVNEKSDDGSTLTTTNYPDGSSRTDTFDAKTGIYADYQTIYDGMGGYTQTWYASDGSWGENDMSDDGITLKGIATNADGSTVTSTTIFDGKGGYKETWTSSNGQTGIKEKSDDGSIVSTTTNPDGSSITDIYDASTGISTDSQTTYDGNGGYTQTWTASNGSWGENDKSDDGSTLSTTTNPDGSSITNTYNASAGIYGIDEVYSDGSWTDYQTTYDGNGGYDQTWTSSNGQTGVNDKSDDGSTLSTMTNPEGGSTTSTYTASTGIYGYDVVNADGSWTDYSTTYDGNGGYQQTWTASNGSWGENDKSDDGSTLSTTTTADGYTINRTDKDGSGNVVSTDALTVHSTGAKTDDYKNYYNGTVTSETISNTSADGNTITTIDKDLSGNLVDTYTDVFTTDSSGVKTKDEKWYDANGILTGETITNTSADGNTITATDKDGNGSVVDTYTDVFTTDSSGAKTKDEKWYDADGILTWETITNTSADGDTITATDKDGNGSVVDTYTDVFTTDSTGAKTEDEKWYDADGIFTGETITNTSADGNTITATDKDGNGNVTSTSTDVFTTETYNRFNSTTSTYNASTGIYDYDVVNADGSYTDVQTNYNGNGNPEQSWTGTGTSYDASTGVTTNAQITEDGNGGYQNSWTASDGSWGENNRSDDGSTLSTTTNPDGSSTTSTYNASTGVYDYDVVDAYGDYTDYTTTYDGKGGYTQTWTASDGSSGENDMSDDGTLSTTTTDPDGSSTTTTYDPSTGVYGYDVVYWTGDYVDAQATYAGNGEWTSTGTAYNGWTDIYYNDQITYDGNGGYQESWTASDGNWGENDQSDNGSYTDTAYDGNGGYRQTWRNSNEGTSGETDVYDDGGYFYWTNNADGSSTSHGFDASTGMYDDEVDSADGSYTHTQKRRDGSIGIYTYDASTGVYGDKEINANGSWIDTLTTYSAPGIGNDTWTASDGSWGTDSFNLSGLTESTTHYPDGTYTRVSYYWGPVPMCDYSITNTYGANGNLTSSVVRDADGNTYTPGEGASVYVYVDAQHNKYSITIVGTSITKDYIGYSPLPPGVYPVGSGTAVPASGNPVILDDLGQAYEVAAAWTLASGTGTNSAVLEGAKWNGQVITWSIANSPGTASAPFSSYMSNAYETAIQNAFNAWSAATGITFKEVSDSAQSDIRIGWGTFNTAISGEVGRTNYQSNNGQFSPGTIIRLEDPTNAGIDSLQDALVTGADGQLTYAGTQAELSQVLLHEIGHALGLGDNTDPNSIMYYALGANNRTLNSVDITGVQALYGSSPESGTTSGNSNLNQLIQAMATFNTDKGAPVSPLSPQDYALQTNTSLAAISGAGKRPIIG